MIWSVLLSAWGLYVVVTTPESDFSQSVRACVVFPYACCAASLGAGYWNVTVLLVAFQYLAYGAACVVGALGRQLRVVVLCLAAAHALAVGLCQLLG
jgi:hypothetical protein